MTACQTALALAAMAISLSAAAAEESTVAPLNVGDRVQLLLDDHFVAEKTGVALQVTPAYADHRRLIAPDSPGDGNGAFSPLGVVEENGRIRLWYFGMSGDDAQRMCYAESEDGVIWTKPDCGVTEYQGNMHNNIVLSPSAISGRPSAIPTTACITTPVWQRAPGERGCPPSGALDSGTQRRGPAHCCPL